jgi:hypothetical protein
MQLKVILTIQCLIPFLFNCNLLAQQGETPASQYQIESTLEVLQDAKLYPTQKNLCGPCCLYIGARHLGIEQYSIDDIATMADWNISDGTSMLGLQNACRKMSLYAEAFELNTNRLTDLMEQCNALAIIESKKHFYILLKTDNGKFFGATIPLKTNWIEAKKLAEFWDGKALLFSKSPIKAEIGFSKLPLMGGLFGFAVIGVFAMGYFLKKSVSSVRETESTSKHDTKRLMESSK